MRTYVTPEKINKFNPYILSLYLGMWGDQDILAKSDNSNFLNYFKIDSSYPWNVFFGLISYEFINTRLSH